MEIILVDDGSTDNSPAIATGYRDAHPDRIRYVRLEKSQGPGPARNAGLAVAQGEFVGFADSDDHVAPDMYECLYNQAVSEQAQLAVCGMREICDASARDILPDDMTAMSLLMDRRLQPPPWNKIFLRSRLEENGIAFPATYFGDDMVFAAKFLFTEPTIATVKKALYFYEKRTGSISCTLAHRRWALVSLRDMQLYMRRANVYKKFTAAYRKHCFLQAIYYPACLLLIDSLYKGQKRWENLRALPGYLAALARFLAGKEV